MFKSAKCNLCENVFQIVGSNTTRKYCYDCSPTFSKKDKNSHIKRQTQFRRAMKLKAVDLKGGKCSICGYSKSVAALQFHHNNPSEKEFNFNCSYISWERYRKELQKCILLCANCHAELHSKEISS